MQNIAKIIIENILYKHELCSTKNNKYKSIYNCENHDHSKNIEKANKIKNNILNIYSSWGYNYNSIEEIAAKGDIVLNDIYTQHVILMVNEYSIFVSCSINSLYWYSKYGHLHEYKSSEEITDIATKNNDIFIQTPTLFITINDYLEAEYTISILYHEELSHDVICEKCASRGSNVKSARK